MQKNLTQVTEELSNGLNNLYDKNRSESLITLVKRQAEEIDRRGQMIMTLEETALLQKQNIEKLLKQNRELELLVDSMRNERKNLVEEIELLKNTATETKPKVTRKKKTTDEETQAA